MLQLIHEFSKVALNKNKWHLYRLKIDYLKGNLKKSYENKYFEIYLIKQENIYTENYKVLIKENIFVKYNIFLFKKTFKFRGICVDLLYIYNYVMGV